MGKKMSLHHFWADQKIASLWKIFVFWHPVAQAAIYCLLPDTFWQQAFKNALKVGTVNFSNSLSLPSIVKKVSQARDFSTFWQKSAILRSPRAILDPPGRLGASHLRSMFSLFHNFLISCLIACYTHPPP